MYECYFQPWYYVCMSFIHTYIHTYIQYVCLEGKDPKPFTTNHTHTYIGTCACRKSEARLKRKIHICTHNTHIYKYMHCRNERGKTQTRCTCMYTYEIYTWAHTYIHAQMHSQKERGKTRTQYTLLPEFPTEEPSTTARLPACMYVCYVCVYMCVNVFVCVCVHVYIHIYTRLPEFPTEESPPLQGCLCVCVHVCICICVCARACTYTHMCTRASTCTCIYVRMYHEHQSLQ